MSFARTFHYQIPTAITFGPGVASNLGGLVKSYSAKRVFLVTMQDIPAVSRILDILKDADAEVMVFDQVPPNPLTETVEEASKLAKEHDSDLIIGLGGGSSIDAAKAVAILAAHEGKAWEYTVEMGEKKREVINDTPPIIAIPTTAGTGAEVTQNAIVTNPATKQKSPIQSTKICPRHALIDPELTITMPRKVTAATGFDALTHAFERFFGPVPFAFIDAMAEDAMRTVVNNLKRAMDHPNDIETRSAMVWASAQAGLCVLAGDTGESGLHVFSLPLSALFDVAHGEALALAMPFVLPELIKTRPQKVAQFLTVFDENPGDFSVREACQRVVQKMDQWLEEFELKYRLADYGIRESDIKDLAQSVNLNRLNAAWERTVTREEVEQFYLRNL